MTEIAQEEVQSPCIGVCSIDEASGYCAGCYRTVEEIKGWWNMSQPQQAQVPVVYSPAYPAAKVVQLKVQG